MPSNRYQLLACDCNGTWLPKLQLPNLELNTLFFTSSLFQALIVSMWLGAHPGKSPNWSAKEPSQSPALATARQRVAGATGWAQTILAKSTHMYIEDLYLTPKVPPASLTSSRKTWPRQTAWCLGDTCPCLELSWMVFFCNFDCCWIVTTFLLLSISLALVATTHLICPFQEAQMSSLPSALDLIGHLVATLKCFPILLLLFNFNV